MTSKLATWFTSNGRHDLPWRRTRDPWAVLVSEVMLQQTPVSRVINRWQRFLDRWPTPGSCAAARLEEVLQEWDGLGYPRRAANLWRSARTLSSSGWPADEAGLRALPGIGAYTARALLCLALDRPGPPARDVNLGRVAARSFLGVEAAPGGQTEAALAEQRPADMGWRDYTLALFDVGALLCRRRSIACDRCPLAEGCRSRERLAAGVPPSRRRQPPYQGSMRQLRGAVLREMLARPEQSLAELERVAARVPAAARPGAIREALDGLRRDGLLSA